MKQEIRFDGNETSEIVVTLEEWRDRLMTQARRDAKSEPELIIYANGVMDMYNGAKKINKGVYGNG